MNVLYRFTSQSYSFTGNTTAFVQMEDGINEHGLAIGLTSIQPIRIKPGMNAGILLRFFLEKCTCTEDVIKLIYTLPISSAQTFTIADTSGDVAVVECCAERIEVRKPSSRMPYVCATNIFRADDMMPFNIAGIDNWQADERFETLVTTLNHKADTMDLESAAALLAGKHGFLCQYDRATGEDTVWSVIYDLANRKIYRAEGNPARHKFREDTRFHIMR